MAYIVKDSNGNDITEEFRAKSYSGSSQYKAKLTINGDKIWCGLKIIFHEEIISSFVNFSNIKPYNK